MSTVTPPRMSPQPNLRASLQQPLLRLLSAIRRYVMLESLAYLLIACFVWAICWLIFDWGVLFQLSGFDYLREGSFAIQAILRIGMLFILIAVTGWIGVHFLLSRLIQPVTTSELALAMERRFGASLGDRLVTAVELNDWEQAREQGYSPSMLQATTAEAEEQLSHVQVQDVLNTSRLQQRLWLAGGCIIIAFVAAVFLPEVTLTWFERNVLFQAVPWPRATVLELVEFNDRVKAVPFGSELKVTIRSARWAIADRNVSEGWRPVTLGDFSSSALSAWELADMQGVDELNEVLPPSWHGRACDQLELFFREPGSDVQRELGLALIRKLQVYFWEHRQDQTPLPGSLAQYLPEKLRQLPMEQLRTALAAAASLSSADAERVLAGLTMIRPVLGDAVISLGNVSIFPLPNPMPVMSVLQKIAFDRDRDCQAFAMPEIERALLPEAWQKQAIRDLARRLKNFAAEESAESLGKLVIQRGLAFFTDLEERAALKRLATRKAFRKLEVPEKITLEFENLADADDRARGRAKRGSPELKRVAMSNEFTYEFKKMERALRLRAGVNRIVTPWYRVEVKPLPSLKKLVRWHDEPAYLYGSMQRVRVGPLVLPLDGDESRGVAPVGSTLWLEGESHKPLKTVRAITENSVNTPEVEFKEGDTKFTIRLKPALEEDLRLKLEIVDIDGIQAARMILLILTPDKPPEFLKAQFEGVNRKFITAKALLPLSVAVRDDVGILSLEYEVSLQKNDGREAFMVRVPFRGYTPLRLYPSQPGGLRFENPEELTLPRVLAQWSTDAMNDPFHLLSATARLPIGWLNVFPPVRAGLHREFVHDYIDRQLFGPVLRYNDEYLDSLDLRGALNKPAGEPLLDTPYRMVVKLMARDNRMKDLSANHQEGRANETFEFTVVSEQDVIIEGSRREEDLRDRFEESIKELRKAKSSLKRVRDDLDLPTPAKDDDIRRGMNDMQDATKALAQIRGTLDEKVLREFRQIYREFALNRVDERILDRIDRRICNPLAIILQPEQSFAKLESTVDLVARRLESEGSSIPKSLLNDPVTQADRIIIRLEEILNEMRKLIEFNEALRVLRDLINNEQKLVDEMKRLIQQKLKNDLDDK